MTADKPMMIAAALAAALLAGCAAPAGDAARSAASPDYAGWRLYQQQCARCHGATGTGTGDGPSLLARVSSMSRERFADAVLTRYGGTMPPLRGRALQMPAWQGEPEVTAGLDDLYGYLQGRVEGRLGAGRPER